LTWRSARTVREGTNEMQRIIIARQLVERNPV
jgi:alkylation response protein AidB-like acyl-CoA dehydrogenase